MKIYVNGVPRDETKEEAAARKQMELEDLKYYWSVPYDEAVDREIKKRYSPSAETALLRQRDIKAAEFAEYNKYCEDCKALVKQKQAEYS